MKKRKLLLAALVLLVGAASVAASRVTELGPTPPPAKGAAALSGQKGS